MDAVEMEYSSTRSMNTSSYFDNSSAPNLADYVMDPAYIFREIIFRILIPCIGVVGNLLVQLAVYRGLLSKTLPSHLLIANLAISDFVFSLQNVFFTPPSLVFQR